MDLTEKKNNWILHIEPCQIQFCLVYTVHKKQVHVTLLINSDLPHKHLETTAKTMFLSGQLATFWVSLCDYSIRQSENTKTLKPLVNAHL